MLQAIVLAGGLGTRLRGMVPDLPKPMATIAGRPFLEILLDQLAAKGFGRIVLSVGHMAEKIVGHFGPGYAGMVLDYSIEDRPLGTGGALRLALSRIEADHAFIFNGDTFLDLEVDAVERQWQERRRPIIICKAVQDSGRYGAVALDRTGRLLSAFIEKGATGPGLINVGCYVFPRGQLDAFPAGEPFSLEADYLAKAIPALEVEVFRTRGEFIDIGVPEDYQRAQVLLARHGAGSGPAPRPA